MFAEKYGNVVIGCMLVVLMLVGVANISEIQKPATVEHMFHVKPIQYRPYMSLRMGEDTELATIDSDPDAKAALSKIWNSLSTAVNDYKESDEIDIAKEKISAAGEGLGSAGEAGSALVDAIKESWASSSDETEFVERAQTAFDAIKANEAVGENAKKLGGATFKTLKNVAIGAFEATKSVTSRLGSDDTFKDGFGELGGAAKKTFNDIKESDKVQEVLSKIKTQ